MTFNKRKNSSTEAKLTNFYFVQLSQYLLLILLLCVQCKSAEGEFIEMPKDSTVIVTQSTFFNCSRSGNQTNEPIWYHHPVNGNRRDVYDFGIITSKYEGRFDIDKNATSGSFNLLVNRPEPADAGRYECVENVDLDRGPSAELTVLDENVACESNKDPYELVGPTACNQNMTQDQLQLMCIVSYSGNFRPQLQWRAVGNAVESLETKCNESGINSVMCNATLEYSLNMTESAYICEMIAAPQYNCSWKVSKIIYALPYNSVKTITTSMEKVCSANTSMGLPCSYKWLKDNTTVQMGDTLKPSEPGRYTCEALCTIRNEQCAFTAMAVDVSESGTGVNKGLLVGLLVMAIIVIAVVIVAGLKFKAWKKSAKKKKDRKAVDSTNSDGQPAESRELLPQPSSQPVSPVDFRRCNIINFLSVGQSMYEGLNGNVCGPGVHKGIKCAFQQIWCNNSGETELVHSNGEQWKKLDNKNLIKYYEVIPKVKSVSIAMEYTEGGTVREVVHKYENDLSMSEIKDWAMQIACGMKYLHKEAIVSAHGRLCSDHIFILETFGGPVKTLKIGCFNLRGPQRRNGSSIQEIFSFSSPEECKEENSSKKSDVWSFGIVIWEMLTRIVPYERIPSFKVLADIIIGATQLTIPVSSSENKELIEILTECRSIDPLHRKSFSKILQQLRDWPV